MTEAANTTKSGAALILSAWHDPAARILNVDLLAVLLALLLPWSTTGFIIAMVLWTIALVPTLDCGALFNSLKRPICVLPTALFALALAGTLWSDASWSARLYAVGPTVKLAALPLLLYHFERTSRGPWVFVAFLISCTLLMAVSFIVAIDPDLSLKFTTAEPGIFVKNYIGQSQEFTLCAVALAYPVMNLLARKQIAPAALLAAIAIGLVVNMAFVVVSRTALVTAPIMLLVFALIHLRWQRAVAVLLVMALLAAAAWIVSPQLRATTASFLTDYQRYETTNRATSIGTRLEIWRKSLRFFAQAPITGHGTGSTRDLFAQVAVGQAGDASAEIFSNPHNQTLNVAVQWGLVGVALLYAMWLSHLGLFRGDGLTASIGLLVVVQNLFTSLFNSHLFDFHEGWMYVLGVGVAGGMILRADRENADAVQLDAPPSVSAPWMELGRGIAGFQQRGRESPIKILAGFVVVIVGFGALFLWNHFDHQRQASRFAEEKTAMMSALERYRVAQGAYPVLPRGDSLLIDLKRELAKGGYLGPELAETAGPDKDARYVSFSGNTYGLLYHVDRSKALPGGVLCMVEYGASATGFWGQPPNCPF